MKLMLPLGTITLIAALLWALASSKTQSNQMWTATIGLLAIGAILVGLFTTKKG